MKLINVNKWLQQNTSHLHSPYVACADYYPFGLTMSDREITTEPYRFGYQGQYSEEESETGWNSFDLRMYDARFGRWMSPDPYGQHSSPYEGMGNNPINRTDPDGGFDWYLNGAGNVVHLAGETGVKAGLTWLASETTTMLSEVVVKSTRYLSATVGGIEAIKNRPKFDKVDLGKSDAGVKLVQNLSFVGVVRRKAGRSPTNMMNMNNRV